MSSIQVLPSKHEVIQFARDLVQYRELMGGGGGRGCKIEEAICISRMGHLGTGLLRGDTDFALTRLLAGRVRGMPVYWEGLGVLCSLQAGALTGVCVNFLLISSSSTYHICVCTLEALGKPL